MNGPGDALATKRAELLDKLRSTPDTGGEALDRFEAQLAAIDALQARLRPRRPAWAAPLAVATLAVLLVAVASIIPLGTTRLELDANVIQLEIRTGPNESLSPLTSESFAVTDFELVGGPDTVPDVSEVTSITILPDSRVELSVDQRRCLTAVPERAVGTRDHAALLVNTIGPPDADGISEPSRIPIGTGATLRFCLPASANFALIASPVSLDISRVQSAGPPEVRESTIVSGVLRFNQTGRRQELDRLDKLRFTDIAGGTLIVSLERQLHIIFAGSVGRPESLHAGSGGMNNLTPTLLDFAVSSPEIRSLFGIITGLVGMLWAAFAYFSGPQRR